ncbi:MAG: YicC family protein [Deltaproteobacteria bacterium]|nr:YicC family protein [Deltaproteobacteria bacterium]
MITSMTGYGRSDTAHEGRRFIVEIKSVNHRNCEISVRLPLQLSPLEIQIKQKVTERIVRGRVELTVKMEQTQQGNLQESIQVNIPLIKGYFEALRRVKKQFGLQEEIKLAHLLGLRDVFSTSEEDLPIDALWAGLEISLDSALEELMAMRRREGASLHRDLCERADTIKDAVDQVRERAPWVVTEYQERLAARIAELTKGIGFDDARLAQEVAFMAEKSDITEELTRLDSHLQQFRSFLDKGGAVGRNLDFLLQEMHREVNTVGSKSSDIDIVRKVIALKTEIAKVREQIQNIE